MSRKAGGFIDRRGKSPFFLQFKPGCDKNDCHCTSMYLFSRDGRMKGKVASALNLDDHPVELIRANEKPEDAISFSDKTPVEEKFSAGGDQGRAQTVAPFRLTFSGRRRQERQRSNGQNP